ILSPNLGCQFKDSRTGKICGSKHFLQVDHVHPRFAGGGNEPFNLRPMCSSHNKFRYTAGC
ncbi:MAG: HNH endonuclease, partial [Bdellovibrionaceae bacterium]|nr:HNH endonuclease [Pseudobdellovibrionaceae bacterium]